jgi:hypothetical protein
LIITSCKVIFLTHFNIPLMNKLIFVESINVGKFSFKGYIVEKNDNVLSYCIFVNDMEVPLIELLPDLERNVKISVNKDIVDFINNNKTPDKKLRMTYFKQFYNFIIASEKKASYMVFKKQKLNYIKNSTEILFIKKSYIDS